MTATKPLSAQLQSLYPGVRIDDITMTKRKFGELLAEARDLEAQRDALLAACRAALEYWDNGTPIHPGALIVDDFRAAIAQAEPVGEQ